MNVRHEAKYLTRVARNLPDGPIPTVLADMLARDLYEAPSGGRPSQIFAGLGDAIRAAFVELDALESKVRAHDQVAMRRAASLALSIERLIA